MLLGFELFIFGLLGVLLGLYGYLWLMYALNLKSLEWNVVSLDLYNDGFITADELRRMADHPPWYVRFVRKFDVTERVALWADGMVRSKRDKEIGDA